VAAEDTAAAVGAAEASVAVEAEGLVASAAVVVSVVVEAARAGEIRRFPIPDSRWR